MKYFLSILFSLFYLISPSQNFYDLKAKTVDGKDFYFSELKGKKVIIVNTASKCGFTPQYADLEKLYQTYKNNDFIIIGFPSNDFLKQEPGTNEEIKRFCSVNYGISFPIMSKIHVKGKNKHPVYKWLTEKEKNGKLNSKVKWNFQKYLIDEKGNLIEVFSPKTNPLDDKIIKYLK